MKLFRAPEPVPVELLDQSLFLAGGIGAGAPVTNWQAELVARLDDTDWTLLNPRRDDYPGHHPNALREQIAWEHRHLRAASAISFWFPAETLCPITLYELGAWSHWRDQGGQGKPLVVGAHPDYQKRADILIQLKLERPEVEVCFSLKRVSQVLHQVAGLTTSSNQVNEAPLFDVVRPATHPNFNEMCFRRTRIANSCFGLKANDWRGSPKPQQPPFDERRLFVCSLV